MVSLTVYDILGREVETILKQPMDAGNHTIQWNAHNLPTGIYFVRMVSRQLHPDPQDGVVEVTATLRNNLRSSGRFFLMCALV